MKKRTKEITCHICQRIITDPKNKSGICNTCRRKGVFGLSSAVGMGIVVKKVGPRIFNFLKIVLKFPKRKL